MSEWVWWRDGINNDAELADALDQLAGNSESNDAAELLEFTANRIRLVLCGEPYFRLRDHRRALG